MKLEIKEKIFRNLVKWTAKIYYQAIYGKKREANIFHRQVSFWEWKS